MGSAAKVGTRSGLGPLARRLTALAAGLVLAACLSAPAPKVLAQDGLKEVVDAATGIRLELPPELLARETKARRGTNWSTADRQINIDTLAYPEDQDFRRLYDALKRIGGRRLDRDTWSDTAVTLSGRDQDGSNFHIELRRQGRQIRGVSLVYSPRATESARRIIARLSETFHPFPDAAPSAERPGPVAAALPATTAGAITVQTNLGVIERDGRFQIAPNASMLAASSRSQIKLWDVASGRPLRILEHTAYFEQFTFLDDGARILSMHKDAEVRIWDSATGQLMTSTRIGAIEPAEHIRSLSHDPSRNLVVLTAWNGPIVIWDYKARLPRAALVFDAAKDKGVRPDAAALSRDGRTLIAGGENVVKRFDVATRREISSIKLRSDLKVVAGGVIDDRFVVTKTADNDCDADLVLATSTGPTLQYAKLDTAPGCKKASDGTVEDDNAYDSIILTVAKDRLFIARRGAASSKVLDLASANSAGTTLPIRDTKGAVVGVDADLTIAALGGGGSLRVVKLSDGSAVSTMKGQGYASTFPIASGDGRQIMLHSDAGAGLQEFAVWPIDGGVPRFQSVQLPAGFSAYHAVPDGNVLLASDGKSAFAAYSILSGAEIGRFSVAGAKELNLARLSPDGRLAMLDIDLDRSGDDSSPAIYLVETATGRLIHEFKPRKIADKNSVFDTDTVRSFAFSADSKRLAVGWIAGSAEVWSLDGMRLLKRMETAEDQTTSLTFSSDDKHLIGGSRDAGIFVWSLETGKLLRTLERSGVAGHVSTGSVGISHDSQLIAAGPRQRATSSGDVGRERRVQVWDLASGKPRFLLSGHEANVNALTFTPDRRWLVSGSNDGTIRYWDRRTGALGATFAVAPGRRWVVVTDKGFFAASANAGDLLSVVRGFQATGIEQMWQSLYAPDLVREHIAGDPNGEVKIAAQHADLSKILDSGPAPAAVIVDPPAAVTESDSIEVRAVIVDAGKGIGRIEWRVNGITAAVSLKHSGTGREITVTQQLSLDPGDNTIELVAYTASNLLASIPARTTIRMTGRTDATKPNLHVLAIGINAYSDKGWTPPGSAETLSFQPLSLAVPDAKSVAAAFKTAGAGQYGDVIVTEALDANATAEGLQGTVERLAAQIRPRDTFVLFAAAHGTSVDGRFYLIPQDYDGGLDPVALGRRAIGQERLQDWVANLIKAKKTILLLDTCESGALVSGFARSRVDVPASDAAMGRLHEATGRPVLTAAAEGKPAFEGYEGHGVFSWAVLDALRNGDRNGNGVIELSELVVHVQDKVPTIAAKLNGRGRAAIVTRGAAEDRQSARFGSRGEDFSLVRKLQ